jgi:hypothetical protein
MCFLGLLQLKQKTKNMKQFLTLIVLLGFFTISFSQEITASKPITREDFLKRSKDQKVAAFIFLGVGATAIAIAAPGNVDFETLGFLVAIGAIGTLTSIPLFIASGRNKRKANAMIASFKMGKMSVPEKSILICSYYPSISLRLNL